MNRTISFSPRYQCSSSIVFLIILSKTRYNILSIKLCLQKRIYCLFTTLAAIFVHFSKMLIRVSRSRTLILVFSIFWIKLFLYSKNFWKQLHFTFVILRHIYKLYHIAADRRAYIFWII